MSQPAQLPALARTTRVAVVAAAILWGGTQCNYGEVAVVEAGLRGHGPLALSIQPDPEDSAVTNTLGWRSGIPDAEVTVSSSDGDSAIGAPLAVLHTDTGGAADLSDLADGHYFIMVRRLLTGAESAALAPGQDVVGFFAQEVVNRGAVRVTAPASHRRSVVISEWAFNLGLVPGVGAYYFGGFLELTNNSDTTVFLDGLIIGEGYNQVADFYLAQPACATTEALWNDPDGVWSRIFDALPGTGRDYPLAPGAAVVIATDAIDHSGIIPGGLDLSHANFDFAGSADVINPTVPSTLDEGPYPDTFGHGMITSQILSGVTFIALPLDPTSLARRRSSNGNLFLRIPRDRVLDVVTLLSKFNTENSAPLCPALVNHAFDRYRGRYMGAGYEDFQRSVQRRVALVRPDGRKVLQHTRTTNADFFVGPRTPGQLP